MSDHRSLAYQVAKRLWDQGERDYWDHPADRREFAPDADPPDCHDTTDDPRIQAFDVLHQVREVLAATTEVQKTAHRKYHGHVSEVCYCDKRRDHFDPPISSSGVL